MACIFCNQDVQTLRAKRKMYVWTCKKENLSCNLTCYNVQYVCIVFDWGTFMENEPFVFSHLHFWPVPLLCHLRSSLFVHFSLHIAVWVAATCRSAAMLLLLWFWLSCVAHLGGGHNMVCQLNWCFTEWWKTQVLFYTPVSVWSCFTLYGDRGHVIAVLN